MSLAIVAAHQDAASEAARRVEGAGPTEITGSTDGSGNMRFAVPVHVTQVRVTVDGLARPLRVRIGHMDPVEQPSGVRKRLQHLNYLGSHLSGDPSMERRTSAALRAFQADVGLKPTGEMDQATRDALLERHGS